MTSAPVMVVNGHAVTPVAGPSILDAHDAGGVADLLHPHFVKEEEYALPPLGLLGAVAQGTITSDMRTVLAMTERLKKEPPEMLAEHREVVGALQALAEAARAEHRVS